MVILWVCYGYPMVLTANYPTLLTTHYSILSYHLEGISYPTAHYIYLVYIP